MTAQPATRSSGWNRAALAATLAVVLAGPALLFSDSLATYRLHSDDFPYLAASRTFPQALANLYVPHNTHIVPSWRLLTWFVVRVAGSLARLPFVLSAVSYAALAILMLLVGVLAARESGRWAVGLLAMAALGTTSVVQSSATWYSSGQTLWAAIGITSTLLALQGWRDRGGWWRLLLAAIWAVAAGGFWTIGHAAGPVGAAYLWADGRRRCRFASAVPLAATLAAVVSALVLGGSRIDARVSFHGRTEREALDLFAGASHTLQAIPENLVFQNLGIEVETTPAQAVAIVVAIGVAWASSLSKTSKSRNFGSNPLIRSRKFLLLSWIWLAIGFAAAIGLRLGFGERGWPLSAFVLMIAAALAVATRADSRPAPLELAGLVLLGSSYYVEWIFRGYQPFGSLRGIVPWYDTIPDVGAVLFAAGWVGRALGRPGAAGPILPTPRILAGVLVFQLALGLVNRPRVDALFRRGIPADSIATVEPLLKTPALKLAAARALAAEFADRQWRDLARLDRAESIARAARIDHDDIASAFGRIQIIELPEVYDANGLMDLPARGPANNPSEVRSRLGDLLEGSPAPRLRPGPDGEFRFE